MAQDVFEFLEQKETELLVKIQTPLKNGTAAVDPTLFSPDIIVLGDVRGFLSLTFDILGNFVKFLVVLS